MTDGDSYISSIILWEYNPYKIVSSGLTYIVSFGLPICEIVFTNIYSALPLNNTKPPSLSGLTPMLFNTGLTHLGSEVFNKFSAILPSECSKI